MAQINFYSLTQGDAESRLEVACRLAEKAFGLGHKIFIQVNDEQQRRQLDELLWRFKANSFILETFTLDSKSKVSCLKLSKASCLDFSLLARNSKGLRHVTFKRASCR